MTDTVGGRERALLTLTVAPFLRGLVGHRTVVELRNGNHVEGIVAAADCYMNVTMDDATLISPFTGVIGHFGFFFIQNKFIQTINIPSNLDVVQVLQLQVDIATGEKRRRELRLVRKNRAKTLRRKEAERIIALASDT